MSAPWRYIKNREILQAEEFGWIPHCVPYRERERVLEDVRSTGSLHVQAGNVWKKSEIRFNSEYSHMIDRNNSDRRGKPDNGGNLTHWVISEYRSPHVYEFYSIRNGIQKLYEGPLILSSNAQMPTGTSVPSTTSEALLFSKGASLVSSAHPLDPGSGLGQLIGELKQGLPRATISTFKSLRSIHRNGADDFLNYQFGWKPLIKDLLQTVQVLQNRNNLIAQYKRDSGRPVRRSRGLPPEQTTTLHVGSLPLVKQGTFYDYGGQLLATGSVMQVDRVDWWFDGQFIYNAPVPDSVMDKLRYYEGLGNRLFGLSLTPELLWELAPWSWLVDWVTNVGDVMSNITAFQQHGMVMPYGYVMNKKVREFTWVGDVFVSDPTRFAVRGPTDRLVRKITYTRRYRRKANPYGFGMTWESLNGTQLAILAALGLTRGRRDD